MAKMPNEIERITQNGRRKRRPATKPSIGSTVLPTEPVGEVQITSLSIIPERERITRSSSSNSASSDTPATHTGSSWDTDREESNILSHEPETDSRIYLLLTPETSQFLQQYFNKIYSQLQNTILNINIIEETVEWQIKSYISESVGIDPAFITSEEIVLFTTDEVKARSRRIADTLIANNQANRDVCHIELHDLNKFRILEKFCAPMKEFLKNIQQLYFEEKDDRTILEALGYAIQSCPNSQENVMSILDPKSKPKLPTRPPYRVDSLDNNFVEEDVAQSLDIVVYQCNFCARNGNDPDGHWESWCPAYKAKQRSERTWQEPPPPPVMPQPSEQLYSYPTGIPQAQYFQPVIYPFPLLQPWHPALLGPFAPQYTDYFFQPYMQPPPQNRHHRSRRNNHRRKDNFYFSPPRNRCVLCNFEAPRHELRCLNKPLNQTQHAAQASVMI